MNSLKPLRGYILVEEIDETSTRPSGLVMPDTAKDKPCKGKVLAVGLPPYAGKEDIPYEWEIKVEEIVVFKKWGGQDIEEKLKLVGFNELMGVYR